MHIEVHFELKCSKVILMITGLLSLFDEAPAIIFTWKFLVPTIKHDLSLTRHWKNYNYFIFLAPRFLRCQINIPFPAWRSSVETLAMASTSEPVTFREFCPLYYLLNAIPTKIQKGFRSIVVYLTALDTNGDYIAVGSSIGMLYLYCRHFNQMKKYNFEVSLYTFFTS